VNDVPRLVSYIAASDKENHVPIQPGAFALGNATLDELWSNQDAKTALYAQHWDYVVMQEHSMQTTRPEWVNAMLGAMTQWNSAIRARGGKPIVYETWARAPGSSWYSTPGLNFGSPEEMQKKIDTVTNDIAVQIQAPVVAAGDYWAKCSKEPQAPQFYSSDGTHASIAGSYLNALLIYKQVSGRMLDGVTFAPPGLTPANVELIKQCASTSPSTNTGR
jgi:hypothetical protein